MNTWEARPGASSSAEVASLRVSPISVRRGVTARSFPGLALAGSGQHRFLDSHLSVLPFCVVCLFHRELSTKSSRTTLKFEEKVTRKQK